MDDVKPGPGAALSGWGLARDAAEFEATTGIVLPDGATWTPATVHSTDGDGVRVPGAVIVEPDHKG